MSGSTTAPMNTTCMRSGGRCRVDRCQRASDLAAIRGRAAGGPGAARSGQPPPEAAEAGVSYHAGLHGGSDRGHGAAAVAPGCLTGVAVGRGRLLPGRSERPARAAERAFTLRCVLGAVPLPAPVLLSADRPLVQSRRGERLPCPATGRDPDRGDAGGVVPAAVEDPRSLCGAVRDHPGDLRWLAAVHRARLLHGERADAVHRHGFPAVSARPGAAVMAPFRDRRGGHRVRWELQADGRLRVAGRAAVLARHPPRPQGAPGSGRRRRGCHWRPTWR